MWFIAGGTSADPTILLSWIPSVIVYNIYKDAAVIGTDIVCAAMRAWIQHPSANWPKRPSMPRSGFATSVTNKKAVLRENRNFQNKASGKKNKCVPSSFVAKTRIPSKEGVKSCVNWSTAALRLPFGQGSEMEFCRLGIRTARARLISMRGCWSVNHFPTDIDRPQKRVKNQSGWKCESTNVCFWALRPSFAKKSFDTRHMVGCIFAYGWMYVWF